MREKEAYRDNLERIISAFPGKEMLKIIEVQRFLGISRNAVTKLFTFNACNMISVATLAREMS